ncbi:MAG: ribosome-associated translation inhibitor RaiA [Rickettsiales bacterium]|jgi:ribosomal subunit interface protein|nr:ribosome-associated translation inhibitor RaiA [Rickettsiales bacterium]
MVTTVSGKHMEVGAALQEYVNERITSGVKKHLNDVTQSKVTFSKNNYLYHVDLVIHDANIGLVKAASESDDAYAAFDSALVKMEKQLRKYKGKIKDHAKKGKENLEEVISGVKYVLNVPQAEVNQEDNQPQEPVTIAEKITNIEKLTVSEAIMKMDLGHLPALLFINKLNDRLNVVYHRVDGNISWVDPGDK